MVSTVSDVPMRLTTESVFVLADGIVGVGIVGAVVVAGIALKLLLKR